MYNCYEYNIDVYMLFIDFKEAVDISTGGKMSLRNLELTKVNQVIELNMEESSRPIVGKTSRAFAVYFRVSIF